MSQFGTIEGVIELAWNYHYWFESRRESWFEVTGIATDSILERDAFLRAPQSICRLPTALGCD